MFMSLFVVSAWSDMVRGVVALSDSLYELCNQIAGRFWLLDNLISLPVYNQLVKAALLGGCFLAVWHAHQPEQVVRRNRHILLVTLLASVCVLAANRAISTSILLPRPFVQSQVAYQLEGDRLVESRVVPYRVPLDSADQAKYRHLLQGDVISNDLDAFPSDHAAFYVTIAAGILLASRGIGWLAMGWTCLVLLGARVVTGEHSPLDIVVGSVIGVTILLVFQYAFDRWFRRPMEPVVGWTLRHQALASVLVFMALFEVANTLQDVDSLLETGAAIARYFRVG
jgi:membrane-associated phospholipid phosphatase